MTAFKYWILRPNFQVVFGILRRNWLKSVIFTSFILICWTFVILSREPDYVIYKRQNKLQLFSFRNFFYPKSKEFESGNSGALAVIIGMDKNISTEWLQPVCFLQFNNSVIIRRPGQVFPITHEKTSLCRLMQYRIACASLHLNGAQIEAVKTQSDRFKFTLQVFDQEPIQLPLIMADQKPRTLIICPGRMFAFDMWHLFLLAMELYRIQQVDLVVIYISSVDARIHQIIREYAMEDWVEIRPSLRLPEKAGGLPYDPNSENTWNSQVINFHDCMFEFRESAEFIAFPDWDDLLVGGKMDRDFGKYLRPLGDIFKKLSVEQSNVAVFMIKRTSGRLKKLKNIYEMRGKEALVPDMIMDDIVDALSTTHEEFVGNGKPVCRPLLTNAVELHEAAYLKPNYIQQYVGWDETFIVHARNLEIKHGRHLRNDTELREGILKFLERPVFNKLLEKLPKEEIMLDAFNSCLGTPNDPWRKIINKVLETKGSLCYNYRQCDLKLKHAECTNVNSNWIEWELEKDKVFVSYYKSAKFTKNSYCVV